ncbi:MAG: cupin domain-containing protein [Myxococcales bacterium]|nr:cupin domain-containing protein [Myxococcales bacterium]
MSQRPRFIVRAADVPEEEGAYPPPFDGEKLSLGRNLGKAAHTVAMGLWQERIPPGRRTSFTHAHSHEEELVYVLAGTCTVRLVYPDGRSEEWPMQGGDVASFRAGTGIAHCFRNDGAPGGEDCVLLCVGERKREVDRAWYPDDPAYDEHRRTHEPDRSWRPTIK